MKRKQVASILALVFAATVLLLQFLRISLINGEMVVAFQLPMMAGETASLLTMIESTIAFLIPASLVVFCTLLVFIEYRNESSITQIGNRRKLLVYPLIIFVISALQKTLYIYLYEGNFSIEYTWLELLTSVTLITVFTLIILEKIKSGYWLMILCFVFALVEVLRLCIPDTFYSYVTGSNISIFAFVSAVSFYVSYLFVGLSFVLYHHTSAKQSIL